MASTCSNCSWQLGDDDAFCGICGQSAPLAESSAAAPATVAAEPVMATVAGIPSIAWPDSDNGSRPAPSFPQGDAAVGQATPNATYIGMRLMYSPIPEPTFDPLFNWRFAVQMAVRYWLYGWVYLFGALAGIVICVPIAFAGSIDVAIGRLTGQGHGIVGSTISLVETAG